MPDIQVSQFNAIRNIRIVFVVNYPRLKSQERNISSLQLTRIQPARISPAESCVEAGQLGGGLLGELPCQGVH